MNTCINRIVGNNRNKEMNIPFFVVCEPFWLLLLRSSPTSSSNSICTLINGSYNRRNLDAMPMITKRKLRYTSFSLQLQKENKCQRMPKL